MSGAMQFQRARKPTRNPMVRVHVRTLATLLVTTNIREHSSG
jgi:hypothetical protein